MNKILHRILNTKTDKTGYVVGNNANECWLSFVEGILVGANFGFASGQEALEEWFTAPFETFGCHWGMEAQRNLDLSIGQLHQLAIGADERLFIRQRALDYLYSPHLHDAVTMIEFGLPILSRPHSSHAAWQTMRQIATYLESWRSHEITFLAGDVKTIILEAEIYHVAVPKNLGWIIASTDKPQETAAALKKELYETTRRT
jgi:hypothetical protein